MAPKRPRPSAASKPKPSQSKASSVSSVGSRVGVAKPPTHRVRIANHRSGSCVGLTISCAWIRWVRLRSQLMNLQRPPARSPTRATNPTKNGLHSPLPTAPRGRTLPSSTPELCTRAICSDPLVSSGEQNERFQRWRRLRNAHRSSSRTRAALWRQVRDRGREERYQSLLASLIAVQHLKQ